MPCTMPNGPPSKEWGILAREQASRDPGHCSRCLGLLFVSGASGAHPCPGGDGGQLPGGSATWLLPLIRALTSASLTGLPTPGSEGEFDMKLKIAAVLFLCWGKGPAGGRQLPLMTCPQRTKPFSALALLLQHPGLLCSPRGSLDGGPAGRGRPGSRAPSGTAQPAGARGLWAGLCWGGACTCQ